MSIREPTRAQLLAEVRELRARLADAEETIRAIREGDVDALVLPTPTGPQVFSVQRAQTNALVLPPSGAPQVFSLHAAEEPYRLLIERMNEGAAMLLPDGLIVYCNRRLAEMLRLPLERVQGEKLHHFVAPAERDALSRILGKFDEGAAADFQLEGHEGQQVPVVLSLSSIRIGDKAYAGAVIADVTQLRLAAQALRDSEERYHQLEIERAQAQIKRLQAILPICSICRRVRKDQNYWQQVESYISEQSNVTFSHGLCPECAATAMKQARDELGIADAPSDAVRGADRRGAGGSG